MFSFAVCEQRYADDADVVGISLCAVNYLAAPVSILCILNNINDINQV